MNESRVQRLRRGLGPFVVASLLICMGQSCDDDFQVSVLPPPLFVRSTTPADSAQLDQPDPINLSITFNRVTKVSEVILDLYPVPAAAGTLQTTGSGRNITWFDLSVNPTRNVHTLLIDSQAMENPFLLEWNTGPRPFGRFSGVVTSEAPAVESPEGAVIFALDELSPFSPLQPESFLDIRAERISSVGFVNSVDEGLYGVSGADTNDVFLVVVVKDTSGDGIYDPRDDWWGFYGNELTNEPFSVPANGGLFNSRVDIDVKIRAPR